MNTVIVDILGWLGSSLIILACILTSNNFERFRKVSIYMNLIGGLLIAYNCFENQAIPPFITNLLWSGIAIYTLVKSTIRTRIKPNGNKKQLI